MSDKLLQRKSFCFNKKDNGGEALILTTEFYANGDPITPDTGVYLNQTITLNSYSNSAAFTLCGAFLTPTVLRELANELESARNKIQ